MITYSVLFLIGFICAWVSLRDMSRENRPALNSFLVVLNIALMIYWAIQINNLF